MSDIDVERERRIRERAYFLWLEAGCPDGKDIEFWTRAQTLEADPLPRASGLPLSAVKGGAVDGVARGTRQTESALHRPSPSILSSSAAPPVRPALRPVSVLLAITALILGVTWAARHSRTRHAELARESGGRKVSGARR
ncbi:DUF2934 domain-containing protein [Paracraurococcus lichenis]|uniref:DUF2934 domain-containing protein n=1 Tax=Paracraurococcus lichenis TaxID=3064888 RepID=A0ABT9E929_9PROT|nr:DUF2934 domain-containing protein [Paracraurococcus sp. LOR1-02]MDO9712693.1 DUF2934 domain-containing protein [Paracraurococcus sp. LOR1-02]